MKLNISYKELEQYLEVKLPSSNTTIHQVVIDSRRIVNGHSVLFVAFKGSFRDGHEFIDEAYSKGVRTFLISEPVDESDFPGAAFIKVEDTLRALQKMAKYHRMRFSIPVIAITGSAGKTIVKEWLGQMLDLKFRVVRSPKSYNSQLGVALSLLEMHEDCDIAIIEAGISEPGQMQKLEEIIMPTHGVFTSLGSAHAQNFPSKEVQLSEKLTLFPRCERVFVHHSIPVQEQDEKIDVVKEKSFSELLELLPFSDEMSRHNAALAISVAQFFGVEREKIEEVLPRLNRVSLRLETFDGNNNCLVINDTYNLDLDAFRSSLEYQLAVAKGRHRTVVIGTQDEQDEIIKVLQDFEPIEYHFVSSPEDTLPTFRNTVVLVKGRRELRMEKLALRLRKRKHQTYV